MKEALRYLNNAKTTLRAIPIENRIYADVKPVREAFGTAYLAVLEAINEALLRKGTGKRELPKSVEAYRQILRKRFAAHNGNLLKEFDMLYDALHIAGYYRGLIYDVAMVKDAFARARAFIDKIES
jgi:hypothetical protein